MKKVPAEPFHVVRKYARFARLACSFVKLQGFTKQAVMVPTCTASNFLGEGSLATDPPMEYQELGIDLKGTIIRHATFDGRNVF